MPKNLHDSKRTRASEVTSVLTNKHKDARQRHVTMHSMGVQGRLHNHHSHLTRRCAPDHVAFDDKIKTISKEICRCNRIVVDDNQKFRARLFKW